ncbi:hypothetical protein QR680_012200 [Steinernema hermaphroditum]|uniref:Uncharacterized protein n=1 Tax=Steinernema hermaphroditum TaxID=289476 RepID=A0AA39I384_9BILA|nr:hypothetical protein QR680_012200 [Steinernema hermaphroditum]
MTNGTFLRPLNPCFQKHIIVMFGQTVFVLQRLLVRIALFTFVFVLISVSSSTNLSTAASYESAIGTHPIYSKIRKTIPRPANNESLHVHIGFYLESLGNFRSTEMAFDVDLYLYMSWKDPTLNHSQKGYFLINDKNILNQIWLPDLYFANARTAYFHDVTVPNFNMFIDKEGRVSYGTRVTLNVACNLNLKNYPLDQQLCLIKIISYAHVKSEMNTTWFSNKPIRYNPEIGLPEFRIGSIKHDYCNGTFMYTLTDTSHRVGDFSCLLGMIQLERSIGYHLVQSYIPTGLIVVISWVSFWIDRRAVPARVSLSFTTLLTLSTQGNGLRYALPPVSYAKAIDYWYGVCMLFIFGVLLEFALVNSYMRRANKYNQLAQHYKWNSPQTVIPTEVDSDNDEAYTRYHPASCLSQPQLIYKAMYFSRRALAVDQISRLAFPGVFVCFNFIYWYYYLNAL